MIRTDPHARLNELLVEDVLEGLAGPQREELAALLAEHPRADGESLERTAAAVQLASIADELEPMPARMRARVEAGAIEWLAGQRNLRLVPGDPHRERPAAPPRLRAWAPWLAAAAAIALAVTAWWPGGDAPAAERLAELLEAPGTSTFAWADNDAGVTGEVVWNGRRQEGFLRLRGLAVNDPQRLQYQLWIFDEGRRGYSDDIAVDGGVFDVDRARGMVIVPIRAKLRVSEPALFAVTTEPPGGVVKHDPQRDPDRYRVVLTAPARG